MPQSRVERGGRTSGDMCVLLYETVCVVVRRAAWWWWRVERVEYLDVASLCASVDPGLLSSDRG